MTDRKRAEEIVEFCIAEDCSCTQRITKILSEVRIEERKRYSEIAMNYNKREQ